MSLPSGESCGSPRRAILRRACTSKGSFCAWSGAATRHKTHAHEVRSINSIVAPSPPALTLKTLNNAGSNQKDDREDEPAAVMEAAHADEDERDGHGQAQDKDSEGGAL